MRSRFAPAVVLVADDSAVARFAIVRRLRAEGLDVLECDSAGAARGLAIGGLTCAILDLDLGDGDGVEVALLLHGTRPGLAVAFFSSGATADVEARAKELGPIFAKPDALEDTVAWALAQCG